MRPLGPMFWNIFQLQSTVDLIFTPPTRPLCSELELVETSEWEEEKEEEEASIHHISAKSRLLQLLQEPLPVWKVIGGLVR